MHTTDSHRLQRVALGLAVVMAAGALAACGGSAEATDTTPGTSAGSADTSRVVTVEVGETSTEMFLRADPTTISAGEVTFEVTNSSDLRDHEFVVIKTDRAISDLPYDADAREIIEDADGLTPIDEIGDLPHGTTASLTVDLEPGHYILVCNIERHFDLGMVAEFDVTA